MAKQLKQAVARTYRCDPELDAAFEEKAAEEGLSKSECLRNLIKKYLEGK